MNIGNFLLVDPMGPPSSNMYHCVVMISTTKYVATVPVPNFYVAWAGRCTKGARELVF